MSDPQQFNPVVFYPPALDPSNRMPGDFRPLPPKESEPVKEEAADEPDPKDLSVPESVPSSPSEVSQSPVTLEPPAMNVIAEKDNGKPKVSGLSTPTS